MVIPKSDQDIKVMKQAGKIAAQALDVAGEAVKPGVSTLYIDKIVYEYIKSKGAHPSFLGYNNFPASSCISINNEVNHGIPSKTRIIKEGDIVGIDIGVFYKGFHGDNAATFKVGNISKDIQQLLDVTKESLMLGIEKAIIGNRIGDISNAIQTYAESYGYGVVREYVGHGIGKDLHESPPVPNFGHSGRGRRLEKGMTIAIEPMINMGSEEIKYLNDGWTVVTMDGSLSAQFEHTIAITDDGPVILTL